jgi:hypothetical protein
METKYDLLIACYESGQIEEDEWHKILRGDEVFKKYYQSNLLSLPHQI